MWSFVDVGFCDFVLYPNQFTSRLQDSRIYVLSFVASPYLCCFIMAFNKSVAVVFFMAVLTDAISAQDLGNLSPAPSPSMDKGAGYSLGCLEDYTYVLHRILCI